MKNIFLLLLISTLVSCHKTVKYDKVQVNGAITNDSSKNELERALSDLRNICFYDCLSTLEDNSLKKININRHDSCYKKVKTDDFTGGVYFQCINLNLEYVLNDLNRKRLVERWASKTEIYLKKYEMNIGWENKSIRNNLNVMIALDFYNSKDLDQYIDSVRNVEIMNNPKWRK